MADLEPREAGPYTVAIAVNGRVAAVSPTWRSGDRLHHVEAMLLPETLRDGRNRIELYVVGGREGRRRLVPVELTP